MNSRTISIRWITDRNYDLLWYIGACISSYALIYLNVGLGITALLLWWFWIISVDGPHVFATISRTYLDSEERKARSKLLTGSLLWFLLGPSAILLGILTGTRLTFFLFLAFAQLWAYWHVVRQHYGFLVLYQKKNGEPSGRANPIDYWIFYILMLAPFVSFLLRHPEARAELGLSLQMSAPEYWTLILLHSLIGGAILIYVAKEVRNNNVNLPKNLFLMACVPLHLFLFLHPYISTKLDLRLFVVFVTFYHNVQYHGIVWFYNRNRYGQDQEGTRFGLASRVSRSFLTYYVIGVLFTVFYRYPQWFCIGLAVPFAPGPNWISETSMGSLFKISDLAIAFWWGFALNHYYLDQKIWRLSRDQQLNKDLKVSVLPRTA